jgi:hypothetical protein
MMLMVTHPFSVCCFVARRFAVCRRPLCSRATNAADRPGRDRFAFAAAQMESQSPGVVPVGPQIVGKLVLVGIGRKALIKPIVYDLYDLVQTIGSGPRNDIVVRHPSISERHAVLEINLEHGMFTLQDQRSLRGCCLGLRLPAAAAVAGTGAGAGGFGGEEDLSDDEGGSGAIARAGSTAAPDPSALVRRESVIKAALAASRKLVIPSNSYITIGEVHFHFNCFHQRLYEL